LRRRGVGAAFLAAAAAACTTAGPPPKPQPGPQTPPPRPAPASPEAPAPGPSSSLQSLPGWLEADHAGAFAAFVSTCGVAAAPDMAQACRRARTTPQLDAVHARAFFEANFRVEPSVGEGMLTAYFAPEYAARTQPDAEFSAPVRGKPADLVMVDGALLDGALQGRKTPARRIGGRIEAYPDRTAIETSAAAGQALAWMRPEDLFFLQVQGSGVLAFPDGRRLKAGVAATNGRPYLAIGGALRERGLLAPDATTAEGIRQWLAARRGPEADAIMRLNKRYVFFRVSPDDGRAPAGAAGIPLPAGHAAAVDPAAHAMGELLWIDADEPTLAGAKPFYRRLVVALDVGAAIRGPARADLYLGEGAGPGAEAGTVRHVLRLRRLAPIVGAPSR